MADINETDKENKIKRKKNKQLNSLIRGSN